MNPKQTHFNYIVSEIKRLDLEAVAKFGGKNTPDKYHGQFISYTDLVMLWDDHKFNITKDHSTWKIGDFEIEVHYSVDYTLYPLAYVLSAYYANVIQNNI